MAGRNQVLIAFVHDVFGRVDGSEGALASIEQSLPPLFSINLT